MDNKEKVDLLLLAEFQLKINAWKEAVAQWEKEIEEQWLKENQG